jgi:hypothetical protein
MKNKKLLALALLLTCIPLIISAQSNTVIDELLNEDKADWGRTSYMVLSAAEIISENEAIPEVLTKLAEQQWNLPSKLSEDPITLGEYSYMLMKAFDIPGGIMYKIVPGPRYAARELSYLKFIDKDKSPYRTLSGEEVLRIMGRVMEWKEAGL